MRQVVQRSLPLIRESTDYIPIKSWNRRSQGQMTLQGNPFRYTQIR